MIYRVILTKNGEYKKTLHKCKKRKTSFINFNRIKEENSVIFEKKFVNYNGIVPVKYKIYIVKDYEDSDTPRTIRNEIGKWVTEGKMFDIWTILNDADYKVEETFWVYGHDPMTERKTIMDILGLLMIGISDPMNVKQIIVINNKLVIYSEKQFDMVICKCKRDAQRLHHALAKAAMDNEIKNLLFMGTAGKKIAGDYYEIIHEKTGWDYTKIWRTTTRP